MGKCKTSLVNRTLTVHEEMFTQGEGQGPAWFPEDEIWVAGKKGLRRRSPRESLVPLVWLGLVFRVNYKLASSRSRVHRTHPSSHRPSFRLHAFPAFR